MKNRVMPKKDYNELLNWLANGEVANLSEEEIAQLVRMFEGDDEKVIEQWIESRTLKVEPVSKSEVEELELLYSRIRTRIMELHSGGRGVVFHLKFYRKLFQKVAAILFIPLLFFSGYKIFYSNISSRNISGNEILYNAGKSLRSQEYYSPAGTRSKIILDDKTVVWLNSSSRLLVADGYGISGRKVSLKGQAYFDVVKNPAQPFVVSLPDDVNLKVTGTTFSVDAYDDSKPIETVLVKGVVFVNQKGYSVKLLPSQKAVVSKSNGKITIRNVEDESYQMWKDGILIFNTEPLSNVIPTLERWFNVNITVEDPEIYDYKITARLDNCSLDQVLSYLSLSSMLKYHVKDKEVIITRKK